jgi:hypothetical protein
VLNTKVAKVFGAVKIEVVFADRATKVATPVLSLKVYKPKRIRDVPDVKVPAEAILIELTVVVHIDVKNVK